MPGALAAAVATVVMPQGLCVLFEQSREYAINVNEYQNGERQRMVKVSSSRKTWRQSRRPGYSDAAALRDFYLQQNGPHVPFYFYDPFESTTFGHFDPSGSSDDGRFIVRFATPLQVSMGMGRTQLDYSFIEVQ